MEQEDTWIALQTTNNKTQFNMKKQEYAKANKEWLQEKAKEE